MGRALVLVPTYNEAATLQDLVNALLEVHECDVLVIDDASPDGTGALAEALHARAPERVAVLHRPMKEGLGRAYAAGYAVARDAGYPIVAQMDADFSHDPADLPQLLTAVEAGADLAIGSRYVRGGRTPGWPWHRRLLSIGGSRYAAAVLGVPVHDLTSGFRAFSARALQALDPQDLRAAGFGIQIETAYLLHRRGLRLREVAITFRDRRAGVSKMSGAIIGEALLLPWRLRRADAAGAHAPERVAPSGGWVPSAAGVVSDSRHMRVPVRIGEEPSSLNGLAAGHDLATDAADGEAVA
jgi:dolichol-phosphate mannosyltransferase